MYLAKIDHAKELQTKLCCTYAHQSAYRFAVKPNGSISCFQSRSFLNVMCMRFPKAYDVPTLKQMGSVPKTAQGSIKKRGLFLFPPATLLKNLQPKVTQRVGNLRLAWPLKGADSILIARRFRRCSQVSSPISWVVRLQASPAWLQCWRLDTAWVEQLEMCKMPTCCRKHRTFGPSKSLRRDQQPSQLPQC